MKTCFLILFLFFYTFSIGGNSARLYAGEPDSQGTPPQGNNSYAVPATSTPDSLTTATYNGGNSAGIMFDVQVKDYNLSIHSFDMYMYTYGQYGGSRRVYFYYKEGTYWGAEHEPMNWILHDSVDVHMSGENYQNNVYIPIILNKAIPLQAGKIYGIYITQGLENENNIFNCTGLPPISNGRLTIFPGTKLQNRRFLNGDFPETDRKDGYMFSGTIHYDYSFECPEDIVVNNEPGTCGARVNYPSLTAEGGLNSGAVFPAGTTPASVSVTDASNNTTYNCNLDVMVHDTEKPNFGFGEVGPIRADFFDGISFNKSLAYQGYDLASFAWKYAETVAAINFNWGTSFPRADLLGTQYFSVRFTSSFTAPVTGTYSFRTVTDDGVRLYLNNTLMFDEWRLMDNGSSSCNIDLTEGETIPVMMEYYAYYVKAEAYLYYISPGSAEKIFATVPKVYEEKVVETQECFYKVQGTEFDPVTGDNCALTLTNDHNHLSSLSDAEFPAGTTPVVWTATDAAGNVSTCSYQVTVTGKLPPVAVCQNITAQLDAGGNVTIAENAVDNGSFDPCGKVTFDTDKTSFSCADLGPNQVVLTVTDLSGNSATCTALVTVEDRIPPILQLRNHCVFLTEKGKWTLNNSDIVQITAGSTDNCPGAENLVFHLSKRSFGCSDAYPPFPEVMVSVTDAGGNTSTGTFELMVLDTITPVAKCRNIEVELDAFGMALVVPGFVNEGGDRENVPEWAQYYQDLEGGSYDNCGIAEMVLNKSIFTRQNIGVNDVVLTVSDPSGNSAECQATVTVSDPFAEEAGTAQESDEVVTPPVVPNSAPTLADLTDMEITNEPQELRVALTNITPGTETSQMVTLTASADNPLLITGMEVIHQSGATTGNLLITFAAGTTGEALVTITVRDNGGVENGGTDTTIKSFRIKVTKVKDEEVAETSTTENTSVVTSSDGVAENRGIRLYPNPTMGVVHIIMSESALNEPDIRVYSIVGNEVFRRTDLSGPQITVDLSGYVPGIYLIRVTCDGDSFLRKVVLEKQ